MEKFSQEACSSLASRKADKYSNGQKASREIKLKSNESRLPQFNEVKQRKKIQPANSAEKIILQKNELKLNRNLKKTQSKLKDKIQPLNSDERQPYRRLKIKGKLKLFDETKKKNK